MKITTLTKSVCGGLILALLLAACSMAPAPEPVRVFAAASLTDAFNELAAAFEAAHPDSDVQLNYASSSTLATQLLEGGTANVFASANPDQMQIVVAAGRMRDIPQPFATNRLTIIVPADNPAGIQSPADLARPGIRLVLAAPGVPVREYSDTAIGRLGDADYQAAVYANLASEEENVRIVVTKVALGEADAGIVYSSDVTPAVADQLLQVSIPEKANVVAVYPIAVLGDAPRPDLAKLFVDFVLSDQGQDILQKWGFGPKP